MTTSTAMADLVDDSQPGTRDGLNITGQFGTKDETYDYQNGGDAADLQEMRDEVAEQSWNKHTDCS